MIQSTYTMAFSLGVFHTYFENDVCTCLQFTPDVSTAPLLNKYGFKMRDKINGFDFFFNGTGTATEILNYIAHATGQNYFEFTITSTDPAFLMFTDVTGDWLGQLTFDSSSASNQSSNGTVVLAEILAPSVLAANIGTVKIYFADILSGTSPVFEIRLNARSTQWQYYIVNKSSAQLDNPAITGKSAISFEGPENVTIPTGQQAMLFSSGDTLLPLSEVPKYKFDLVNNSTTANASAAKKLSSGKIVFKGLPVPDPGNTGSVMINGKKQSSSPIYVYV